jgi:hypothetical protein
MARHKAVLDTLPLLKVMGDREIRVGRADFKEAIEQAMNQKFRADGSRLRTVKVPGEEFAYLITEEEWMELLRVYRREFKR